MAATVWMLAGVSSTTRMRSFMARSSDAVDGRRALEQRERFGEGIALDVLLEFSEVVAGQEEAERLAMAVQDVGGGRIEFAELCPHLRHERLERFGILGLWCRRRAGERRRVTQRGPHSADECAQLVC